ncbi:MAG: hypothetical protein CBB97_19760 [Candidatus Endolissoclinum sp. TMED37]|nr:MAG: hypothetical protein CBB97_19760 [Candidatus Endolissoclinum sp. TMED37]|tara:strand:- start:3908 stop:4879 length:972 start_codon:yes stop_codon:yes gene_type:complete
MNILVTGSAGFIGFHLIQKLCLKNKKSKIIGLDNLNNYYDISLKRDRNKILKKNRKFTFIKADIKNRSKLLKICKKNKIQIIIHLAAQAGVRYSILNPKTYFDNNILGTFNILEVAKEIRAKHLMIASSSSVYGNTKKFPLKEIYNTDTPLSFYAASKKNCEILAHAYSNIHMLPITMMRFFTVYGPYGRPDMALFKFTKSIINNTKVDLFNHGKHLRDFTNIEDVCGIVYELIKKIPKKKIPYQVYNLGGGKPEKLLHFLSLIEKYTGKKAKKNMIKMQDGDVYKTASCTRKIKNTIEYRHKVSIDKGVRSFVDWFKNYYKT